MKKILLLGGSAQQVVAIETAKRLGYYTVLCDFLEDNPGQYVADKFYLVSTTDREAVLKVAKKENIDGVIAYASDPAAPTAAYVAEVMGLFGNPLESVEILCNKGKFREFLKDNNFCAPNAKGYFDTEAAELDIKNGIYALPVIIKPVDSSGSKGVTVVYNLADLSEAIHNAFSFSRSHRVIVEEYIEKNHKYLIGGDIFVKNGKIVLWGLLNCHRDNTVNSLVPVGKSYPLMLAETDINTVKNTLQDIVEKLKISNGAMNVELVVDAMHRVWPIDIGPRNGGNMIPDLLGYIFGVDVVEMSVKTAMGEDFECNLSGGEKYYATHNIHSTKDGVYKSIKLSDNIEKHIIKKYFYKSDGDSVEYFDNASKALGIIFLKFDNKDIMSNILDNINSHINIVLEEVTS